ncbi:MAG: PIN domain-containing protein [Patescibacteria group bacterium]
MPKKKFILLDTNIYLHFCFLDLNLESGNETIEELKKSLDRKNGVLLLPEVVELEFEKRFRAKKHDFENYFNKLSEFLGKEKIPSKKAHTSLKEAIDKCKRVMLAEFDRAKDEVVNIFNHKATVRIELTELNLLDSYKSFLRGEKPNKKRFEGIQNDSLIISSAARYLEGINEYELYVSTNDREDYLENPKEKDEDRQVIIKTIWNKFLQGSVKYFNDPLKMMNENFGTKFTDLSISVFESIRVADSVSSSIAERYRHPFSIQDSEMSIDDHSIMKCCRKCGSSDVPFNTGFCSVCLAGGNSMSATLANFKTCTTIGCDNVYFQSLSLPSDGKCENCKLSGSVGQSGFSLGI